MKSWKIPSENKYILQNTRILIPIESYMLDMPAATALASQNTNNSAQHKTVESTKTFAKHFL